MRYFSFTHGNNPKETPTFNHFILLGVAREQLCVVVFTNNIDWTKMVLQYFPHMNPGTKVFVLNPRLRGFIGESNTALRWTNQLLIQYNMHCIPLDVPPKPITQNEDYSCFNFRTKHLQTVGATYVFNVCNVCLCQGPGNENDPCECISASSRAIGLTTGPYCLNSSWTGLMCPMWNTRAYHWELQRWPKNLTSFPWSPMMLTMGFAVSLPFKKKMKDSKL